MRWAVQACLALVLAAARWPLGVQGQDTASVSDGSLPALRDDDGRLRASLGGAWWFLPAEGIGEAPPQDGWQAMSLASRDVWERNHWGKHRSEWQGVTCGWYRRRFRVRPEELSGRHGFIRFGAAHAEAEVFLNGRRVGRHVGGLTPFDVAVGTALLGDEVNELLVGCRGPLAGGLEEQPRGAMYRFHAGIWQRVDLELRSVLHIEDVFVIPSVEQGTLTVQTLLRNAGETAVAGRLEQAVLDGEDTLCDLPIEEVVVPGGSSRRVECTVPCPRLERWSPETPRLYRVRSRVVQEGSIRDGVTVRFGYRDVRLRGHRILLNGIPVRLRATWGHSGEWYYGRPATIRETLSVLKAHHVNTVRYHGQPLPPDFYAAADEVGMLVVAESALYHGPGGANALLHTEEWVRRDRNHPSVIIWSGSNEFGHWIVPRDAERTAFLLKQEALIRELDPTRPVMQHGYGPLDGQEAIYNIHYPERALGMEPNCFRWPLDRSVSINPAYPDFAWKQEKPLAIGEHLLGNEGMASLFVGDTVYGRGEEWAYAAELFGRAMDVYRLQGVAHVAPQVFQSSPGGKSVPNPYLAGVARVFRPEGVFFPERCGNYRQGERIRKSVAVFNETSARHSYRLEWYAQPGVEGIGGEHILAVEPGEVLCRNAEFTVPRDRVPSSHELCVVLRRSTGERVGEEHLPLRFYPEATRVRLRSALGLYDPVGLTTDVLACLGVAARPVQQLDGAALEGLRILVLGRDAVQVDTMVPIAAVLERFVREGGHILCLEQSQMPRWLPVPVQMVGAGGSPAETSAFPGGGGLGDVEALSGLGAPGALSYWRPDHVVTEFSLNKPVQGNVLPLVSSNVGLTRTPLLEIPAGKGCYLICQLRVVGAFADEPMAAEALAAMLRYLDERPPTRWGSAVLVAPQESAWVTFLESELKVDARRVTPGEAFDPRAERILVEGSSLDAVTAVGLRDRADAGALVMVHGVTPQGIAGLETLLRTPVSLKEAEPEPIRLAAAAAEYRGLTHLDLAWKHRDGHGLSRQRAQWRVEAEDVRQDTEPPGLLLRRAVGKGEILVNQLLFDREEYDTEPARRFASILLTNLGVPMASMSLLPVHAKGWFYVDLRPFCNARLKADHGNDLRNLPTGEQVFRDVPFYVIPHGENNGLGAVHLDNVLVLEDGTRIGKGEGAVTEIDAIPVRKRVGRLAFLHLAGFRHDLKRYAKPRIAEYVIAYGGGTKDVVPVRSDREVVNWWTDWAQDLPDAKLAWTGSNARTDTIGVFLVEWVNPFPEREVESLTFRSCQSPAWGLTVLAVSGLEIE